MRLTKHSDYAIRVLLHAASLRGSTATIEETAAFHRISTAHLKKVVRTLVSAGFLDGLRGRTGGYRLARPPNEIGLGDVLRATESDFALVECLRPGNACEFTPLCTLPSILDQGVAAMLAVFDGVTLADLRPGAADIAVIAHSVGRRQPGVAGPGDAKPQPASGR